MRLSGGPGPPKANRVVPAASAIVLDDAGRILLHTRTDNGLWSIPSGSMEPGESIAETAIREIREETGIEARVKRLLGVYSNLRHVIAYDDGEVRQQFSVCFLCPISPRSPDSTSTRRSDAESPTYAQQPVEAVIG